MRPFEGEITTIDGVVTGLATGITDQLWLVAGIAIAIAGIIWGLPLAVRFFKRLAR